MTKEEKGLLLKDLCARLPYSVNVLDDMGRTYKLELGTSYLIDLFYENRDYTEAPIRPYLRSMSTMTEEEDLEFIAISSSVINYGTDGNAKHKCKLSIPDIDWLIVHHFDIYGLIEKGLALEAPEGMYEIKQESKIPERPTSIEF